MAKDNIHGGHRERLRARVIADPELDTFTDHEALELLLFYAIPRADTNILAHRLIAKFGSLRAVMDASPEELATVEGIGQSAAVFISVIRSVTRKYLLSRTVGSVRLSDSDALGEALLPYFVGRKEEIAYILFLDKNRRTISCDLVCRGNVNAVTINTARIVSLAKARKAEFAILAHNHTGGFANPSQQDYLTTQKVMLALKEIDVKLLDHLIFADPLGDGELPVIGEFVSLAQSGAFTGR
ncbi:MAG: hypothetical protein E7460_08190 [Ruminococcaceae bacterium]|nr:hypothetical protein [Oscillospiraceae bacterium]